MQVKDWITAGIAIYGAIVSTYLAIRQIQKERRQLKIILEYIAFREVAVLIITNSGHRPITITEIVASVLREGMDHIESVPKNALFGDPAIELPKLLSDGQSVVYELGGVLSGFVMDGFFKKEKNVKITIFDAEGNNYSKYERRMGDAKWGGLGRIDK